MAIIHAAKIFSLLLGLVGSLLLASELRDHPQVKRWLRPLLIALLIGVLTWGFYLLVFPLFDQHALAAFYKAHPYHTGFAPYDNLLNWLALQVGANFGVFELSSVGLVVLFSCLVGYIAYFPLRKEETERLRQTGEATPETQVPAAPGQGGEAAPSHELMATPPAQAVAPGTEATPPPTGESATPAQPIRRATRSGAVARWIGWFIFGALFVTLMGFLIAVDIKVWPTVSAYLAEFQGPAILESVGTLVIMVLVLVASIGAAKLKDKPDLGILGTVLIALSYVIQLGLAWSS